VFAWWPVALADRIEEALRVEGGRRIGRFVERFRHATVHWAIRGRDPFFNINTTADLERAETMVRERGLGR